MESKLTDHDRRISELEKGFVGLEKGHNALRNDMNIAEVRREHIDQRFNVSVQRSTPFQQFPNLSK